MLFSSRVLSYIILSVFRLSYMGQPYIHSRTKNTLTDPVEFASSGLQVGPSILQAIEEKNIIKVQDPYQPVVTKFSAPLTV